MLLTYVDESYTDSRYYIAGLVVPEREVRSLSSALDEVVVKAGKSDDVPAEAELHGHELINGKGRWKALAREVRARIGIFDDAMEAIGAHDVAILLRGMDIDRQRARYADPLPPHRVVLSHLIERIDEYAASQDELTIMIADEVADSEEHQRKLWEYQQFQTEGYRGRKITQIVDTLHFVPSRSSRLLQAADLIAHLHRRRETHQETNDASLRARERMRNRARSRVRHDLCWMP